MKAYIITVIGATFLAAVTGIMAPEKWRGYVQIITGLVIISCILSPVSTIMKSDIFDGFDNIEQNIELQENLQSELVTKELKTRINEDITARIAKEYNLNVTADCEIKVNDNGEIEGVESVRIYGDKLTEGARNRLCEVYGLGKDEVHNE